MFKKIYYSIRFRRNKFKQNRINRLNENRIKKFVSNGKVPWSVGYNEFKEKSINEALNSYQIVQTFRDKKLQLGFGLNLDERIVEYPWIYSKLFSIAGSQEKLSYKNLLDAGSTFNFEYIVNSFKLKDLETTIFTFHPENNCFWKQGISYVFGDLRLLPFKNDYFEVIVSHSTIEHIDMDNSIYGYNEGRSQGEKSYEYLKAILEMLRVLKHNGKLLITFPYGKYEYHGFFQQFDKEMLQKILDILKLHGSYNLDFFKYEKSGWRFAEQTELAMVESYNPHTGKGKSNDGAAHCRSICCIEFVKN